MNVDAIDAWSRAIDKYADAGFLVKAIAVCKMILRLDPEHADAQRKLGQLNSDRGIAAPRPRPAARAAPSNPALPRGAPLDAVALSEVVPGAQRQLTPAGKESGIVVIPIDLAIDEIVIEEIETPDSTPDARTSARRTALQRTPLFSDLSAASLQSLIERCDLVELAPRETLFRQGDRGDTLYVISEGSVAVISEGPPRVSLTTLKEGSFFGEIALVTEQPRSATIEAVEATQLIAIGRTVISDLLADSPELLAVLLRFLRERLVDTLVATSPLFAPFAGEDRRALAAKFEFLEVAAGAQLIAEGERAPGLFVLLSGAAEVVRGWGSTAPQKIARLGRGDLFGEVSLLTSAAAIASVSTISRSWLLSLPSAVFREVIMTHPHVLMFVGDLAEERRRKLEAALRGEGAYDEGRIPLV
jgi:cAMP-dependent protein kinase regulator